MSADCRTAASDLWQFERAARERGHAAIAGVDEVGRGPLAGSVVAACVVLPANFSLDGIADSKKLTELQRERAHDRIRREAIAIGIGEVSPAEIDRINILQATHCAMRMAVSSLTAAIVPSLVLVDGLRVPDLPCREQSSIVKGDSLSASIAAASIIAKVTRDRMMIEADAKYPAYGFARHKGYGAPLHLAALRMHGPCPLHRRSFAPVAAVCHINYGAPEQQEDRLRG